MPSIRLSKSKVMKGLQCPKALYFAVHQPELARPTPPGLQAVFDQGHQVGIEAQKLYPGGILIEAPHTDLASALQKTEQAIAAGALALFEATFMQDGVLVRVDILHRKKVGAPWQIIEVKSTTEVKDQHIQDAAVQAWVLKGVGQPVGSVSVMHINNQCTYPDLSNLFTRVDVSTEVRDFEQSLPEHLRQLKEMLSNPEAPERNIGPHCDDPYECEFKDHCWGAKQIPEISIFDVPALSSSRKWELYAQGVLGIKDLAKLLKGSAAPFKLTHTQQNMVEVTLSGVRIQDQKAIGRKIRKWEYPFYYLDFETIGPAIPRYPGTRPYQQVPFQFSCHIQQNAGAELTHAEYLHDSVSDPREPLIKTMLAAIGPQGSVIAYNKGFEGRCIKELADAFPAHADRLMDVADRLVDPLPIFRAHVYDPEFRGSFSIKSVAPALLGDGLSYEGMAVADGTAAQRAFEELIADRTTAERKQALRQAMLEYCRKDTVAMVKLTEWMAERRTNIR